MRVPRSNICVICAERPATTRDHVPPKGFFKGVIGATLITVPACKLCNGGASSDDEDMRAFISMQVGRQTPESALLWDSFARKSVRRKTSLRNQVLSTARDISMVGKDGLTATRLAIEVPATTIQTVFERTTRGLYFNHTGLVLDTQCKVVATPLVGQPADSLPSEFEYREIGGNACKYWFGVDADDLSSTLWLYCFYDLVWFQVLTGSMCEAD
jgi:hypothetical protein